VVALNQQELVWPILLRPSQAIAGAVLEVPVIRAESYCPVCRAGAAMPGCAHCWSTGRALAIRWVPVAMPAGVLCEGGFRGLTVPRQGAFDWSERSFGRLRVMAWADPQPEPMGPASSQVMLSVEWPHLVATVERQPGTGTPFDFLGMRCEVPGDAPDGEWRRVPGAGLLRLSHEHAADAVARAERGDLILRVGPANCPAAGAATQPLLDVATAAQAEGRAVVAMACAALAGRRGVNGRRGAETLAASRDVLDSVVEAYFLPPEDLAPEAREPALAALAAMRRPGSGGRFLPAFDLASGHRHYRLCTDGPAWSHPWFRVRALALGLMAGLTHDVAGAGAHLAGATFELARDPLSADEADLLAEVVLEHLSAEGRAAFCAHWLRLAGSDGLEEAVSRAAAEAETSSGSGDGSGLTTRWLSFWLMDTIAAATRRQKAHTVRDVLAGHLLDPEPATVGKRDALTDASRELRATLAYDPMRCPGAGLLTRLAPAGADMGTASSAAAEALAVAVWAWSRPGHRRALAAAETLYGAPDTTAADAAREHAALHDLLTQLDWHERAVLVAAEAFEKAASATGSEGLTRLVALLDGFRTRICVTEAHVCNRLARASQTASAPQQALRWLDRAVGHANGALVEQARLRHAGLADDRTAASARRVLATAMGALRAVDDSRPVSADEARPFIENTLDAGLQGIIPFDTRFRMDEIEDADALYARVAPELPHLFENSEPMTREFLVDMLHGWYWLTSYRMLLRVPEAGHVQFVPLQSIRSYRVTPDAVTTSTVSISLRDGRTMNLNAMPNRQAPPQDVVEYVLGLKLWVDLPPVEAKAMSVGGRIAPAQRAALPLYAVPEGLPPTSLAPLALPDAGVVLAALDGSAGQTALDAAEEENA